MVLSFIYMGEPLGILLGSQVARARASCLLSYDWQLNYVAVHLSLGLIAAMVAGAVALVLKLYPPTSSSEAVTSSTQWFSPSLYSLTIEPHATAAPVGSLPS